MVSKLDAEDSAAIPPFDVRSAAADAALDAPAANDAEGAEPEPDVGAEAEADALAGRGSKREMAILPLLVRIRPLCSFDAVLGAAHAEGPLSAPESLGPLLLLLFAFRLLLGWLLPLFFLDRGVLRSASEVPEAPPAPGGAGDEAGVELGVERPETAAEAEAALVLMGNGFSHHKRLRVWRYECSIEKTKTTQRKEMREQVHCTEAFRN